MKLNSIQLWLAIFAISLSSHSVWAQDGSVDLIKLQSEKSASTSGSAKPKSAPSAPDKSEKKDASKSAFLESKFSVSFEKSDISSPDDLTRLGINWAISLGYSHFKECRPIDPKSINQVPRCEFSKKFCEYRVLSENCTFVNPPVFCPPGTKARTLDQQHREVKVCIKDSSASTSPMGSSAPGASAHGAH